MKIATRVILLAVAHVFALAATAQTQPTADEVEINANEMVLLEQESRAELTGNVRIVSDELILVADKVDAFFLADDEGGAFSALERAEAEGNITLTQEGRNITADRMDYRFIAEEAEFFDNVVITQGENVITGDRAVLDLATGEYRILGNAKGLLIGGNRQ